MSILDWLKGMLPLHLLLTSSIQNASEAMSSFTQRQVLNRLGGEYLQIDLLNLTEVTAITTQVCNHDHYDGLYYLDSTNYKLQFIPITKNEKIRSEDISRMLL